MNPIEESKKLLTDFQDKHSGELEKFSATSKNLREACGKIERTWSGSFAGWHGTMYFHNFEIPSIYDRFSGEWGGINGIPEGWEEKQPEEVRKKIEELVGGNFSVEKFEDNIKKLRKGADTFKNEITIAFSPFSFNENTTKEKDLFTQIENYKFGKGKGDFISDRLRQTTIMSRDSEAVTEGICLASWLYYEGVALEGKSVSEAISNFLGPVARLVRQLEIKKDTSAPRPVLSSRLSDLHHEIYNKCRSLYEGGEYAEAVEKGFKVVRDRLRILTGYETGSKAFGMGRLHIKGAAATNVDQDFNEGVKFLTMAIDSFRNEKSHTSDAKIDDPTRAYEYLRLSSLAMNLLENTEIRLGSK